MRHDEYVLRDDDGEVTSSVQVHVVNLDKDAPRDPDTDRRLPFRVTTTGGVVDVPDGAVLVKNSEGASFYDVLTQEQFDESGYQSADDASASAPVVEPEPEPEPVDPDADPAATGV